MDKTKQEELEMINERKRQWETEVLSKSIKKMPESQGVFTTMSGEIPVGPLFTPADLGHSDYLKDLGFPGQYPFTRGIQANMYRSRLWTMRSYSGFGSSEDTNNRFKYLLESGITGLSLAFDLPNQIGFDSDHALAKGEVGRVGVAVNSLKDMERIFEGIPLGKISTSMTCNAQTAVILAMYIGVGKKQGVAPEKLRGTIQNDILKEYVARGTYIFPPKPSMRLTTDVIEYCSKNTPNINAISICGYHLREAGATASQEIGFMLANGIAYINSCLEAGLDIDDFGPRLSWLLTSHIDFFEEIAKFRAVRRLWARIAKERFHAKDPRTMMFRVGTGYAGATYTAQQPLNNIVRGTIELLAAVLGGAQSAAAAAYDEALGLPTEEAARIAARTNHIIRHESGVASTVDPLGGSYYIEYLTNELEKRAAEYVRKVDEIGGAVAAVEKGYIQAEIERAAYQYQKEIEEGKRTVVGVNQFIEEETNKARPMKVDPIREREIIDEQKKFKTEGRNNQNVGDALTQLRKEAEGKKNLMPAIIRAVESYATIGEVCGVLRTVFGEYEMRR